MKPKDVDRFNPAAVQQLAHKMVNHWLQKRNIEMRPGDKMALLQMITDTIPTFLETKRSSAYRDYIDSIKRGERQICVDSINKMDEPIPGLVNKQRVLNCCTFSAGSTTDTEHNIFDYFPNHEIHSRNHATRNSAKD